MSSNKINLMLMKNEGQVHRIGLSPFVLRVLICLAVLLPIVCGLSIWLNVHYFFQNRELSNEHAKLQYIVDKNSQNIARLTNLERFLQAHSPGLLNMLVTQADMAELDLDSVENLKDLEKHNSQETPKHQDGEKADSKDIPEDIQTESKESGSASEENSPKDGVAVLAPHSSDGEPTVNNEMNTEIAKNALNGAEATQNQAGQEGNSVDTLHKIDLGLVNLENVKTSYNSANIFISYRLRNTGKNPMVEGVQKYTLINFEDGKFTKIVLNKATDDEFRIKNLKEVSSIIALQGYKISSRDRLQLEIVNDGEVLFRNVYPISR